MRRARRERQHARRGDRGRGPGRRDAGAPRDRPQRPLPPAPGATAAGTQSLPARCLREGRILLVDGGGRHDPATAPLAAHIPIRAAGRSVGVLVLGFHGAPVWSIGEVRAAEAIADCLGLWAAGAALGAVPLTVPNLTTRQHDALRLLADGRSTSEIARALGVSRTTAKNDIRAVIAALGADDRATALQVAAEQGLTGGSGR